MLDLVTILGVNYGMLAIAGQELRRYRIAAELFSRSPASMLAAWSLVEVIVRPGHGNELFAYAALMGSIGVSAITDCATGYILDVIILPSCAFAIVTSAGGTGGGDSAFGALTICGAMLLLHVITRGQGLGLGDVKLAAVAGALLGVRAGLVSLAIAFGLGGCIAAVLMLRGRASRKTVIPFAPYIAAGAVAVLGSGQA